LSWSIWNNQNVRKQEISSSYRSSGNKEGLTSYAKYVSCLILHMSCYNSIPKAGQYSGMTYGILNRNLFPIFLEAGKSSVNVSAELVVTNGPVSIPKMEA
jgi:hypothetical protein